jgi:hypothetical protein
MEIFIVDEADDSDCVNEHSRRFLHQMLQCIRPRPMNAKIDPSSPKIRPNPGELIAKMLPDVVKCCFIGGEYTLLKDCGRFSRFDDFPQVRFWTTADKKPYRQAMVPNGSYE